MGCMARNPVKQKLELKPTDDPRARHCLPWRNPGPAHVLGPGRHFVGMLPETTHFPRCSSPENRILAISKHFSDAPVTSFIKWRACKRRCVSAGEGPYESDGTSRSAWPSVEASSEAGVSCADFATSINIATMIERTPR